MPDNDSFGSGQYPCPKEDKIKRVSGKVYIEININAEYEATTDDDDIKNDVMSNILDYIHDYPKRTYKISSDDLIIEKEA